METFQHGEKSKKGINKVFIGAVAAAVIIVAGLLGIWWLIPTSEQKQSAALENASREGAPEFEELTKKIFVQTFPDRMTQSQTALGAIQMNLGIKIHNRTDRVLSGLEATVAVVDQKNQVIKDKVILVIPRIQETLAPGEAVDLTTTISGFDRDDDRANVRWKITAIKTAP